MNSLPKNTKLTWDLSQLYKKGDRDPQIEKDIRTVERAYVTFEKKYRGVHFAKKLPLLLAALTDYETLSDMPGAARAIRYFWFRKELNAHDHAAEARIRLLSDRLTKVGNLVTFFELAIGAIPKPIQAKILKDKKFSRYHYFLERIFKTAQHNLTEAEENILSRVSSSGSSMWVDGVDRAISGRSVLWQGKPVPLQEALMSVLQKEKQEDRHELWKLIVAKLREVEEFSESEINAIFTRKKVLDEVRKLPKPFSATILGYENDEKSVLALVKAVTESFPVAHRFHAIKKKMLGLKKMTYADRAAPFTGADTKETFPFDRSYALVREAFAQAGEPYAQILDSYLANGQIDVMPKEGKTGGAYCASSRHLPTFVLLNHTDDFNATNTLAHEMGHAIHSEYASAQPALYDGYSTAVAETASTFFEGWAFDHIAQKMPTDMRIKLLHDHLQDQIQTIFRQVACFNFELELHTLLRKEGWVSKEQIASLMQKHMQSYLGPAVEVTPEDGYSFIYWSHIRNFFYVYTYAYGQLISNALLERVRKDKKHMADVDAFMKAGASATPEDIFASIGISLKGARFWKESIKKIEHQIDELEKLL